MNFSNEQMVEYMKMKASADDYSENAPEVVPASLYRQIIKTAKRARKVRKIIGSGRSPKPLVLKGKNLRSQLKQVHQHVVRVDRISKKNDAALRKSLQTTNKDVSKIKAKNKLQDHKMKGQEGALDALMMHRMFTSMLPPKLKQLKLSIDLGPVPVVDDSGAFLDVGSSFPEITNFNEFSTSLLSNNSDEVTGFSLTLNEDKTRRQLIVDASVLASEYDATHDLMLNMISGIWKSYKGATNSFIMPMLMQNMNASKKKKDGDKSTASADNNMMLMMMLMSMNQKSD